MNDDVSDFLEWVDRELEKETRPDGSLTDFGRGMLIVKTKIEERIKERERMEQK